MDLTNLPALNSMTKYPSIPTYHAIDTSPKAKGALTEEVNVVFNGGVYATEKIDGVNARIILFPDGDYVIGSREELLHAKDDRIFNPALKIVETVLINAMDMSSIARSAKMTEPHVFYGEVYGNGVGAKGKHYGAAQDGLRFRVFDVMVLDQYEELLGWSREQIASWRDNGGQKFLLQDQQEFMCGYFNLGRVPLIDENVTKYFIQEKLPTVEGMLDIMQELLPMSFASTLDEAKAEGLVLRTLDRKAIAKVRFEDYERTLRQRNKGPVRQRGSELSEKSLIVYNQG